MEARTGLLLFLSWLQMRTKYQMFLQLGGHLGTIRSRGTFRANNIQEEQFAYDEDPDAFDDISIWQVGSSLIVTVDPLHRHTQL